MAETKGTSEIAALMEAQVDIVEEMIALSQREQQALTRFRPAHLPELLAAQDHCAQRLNGAQVALDGALRALADGLSVDGGGDGAPDLHALLPHLSPDAQARLGTLRGVLEERAYTLAVLNAQNALLVRSGLLQMEQTAAVLADVLGEPRSYGAGGGARIPAAQNTLLLNRQA